MLINLRNALMTGKRLPYDAEVEYLESTGTQWIDTGTLPDLNTTTKATFAFTNTGLNQAFAGALIISGGTTTGRYSPVIIGSAGKFSVFTGLDASTRYDFANADTNTHTIEFNAPTSHDIIFGGESIGRTVDVVGSCNSLTICRRNYDASALPASVKIFGLQIYQAGVLVRDFIPVRKGTVGYLYDRVSGKLFGNAGTGDFVLGPDVVPVEYIESHGTEYIDTGKYPNDVGRWELTIQFTSLAQIGGNDMLNGTYGVANQRFDIGWRYSLNSWQLNIGAIYGIGTRDTNVHTFALNNISGAVSVDGVSISVPTVQFSASSYPILIGNRKYYASSADYFCKEKIFSSKMYDYNNTRVCSFLPVRVGTEGAMMDVLTRRIYRNAGTGAFTYGNDLKYPIPAS